MDVECNLFWEAFGAVGSTIGAIATAAAVIVALWQTKYSHRKKLKLSFSDDIAAISEKDGSIERFIGISVTNIGNREVTITSWGFNLAERGRAMLFVPGASSLAVRAIQTELPYKLELENAITLYYPKEKFAALISEVSAKNELNLHKRIKFYVGDSTNKKYYVKTPQVAAIYKG